MKTLGIGVLAALTGFAMLGMPGAAQCVVTSAPNGDLSLNIGGPNSLVGLDYAEERQIGVASGTPDQSRGTGAGYAEASPVSPPLYMWGFIFGEGTWNYGELNGVPGMQAGGFGIIPETPGCGTIPCIIFNEQVDDETCGAGPDRLIL